MQLMQPWSGMIVQCQTTKFLNAGQISVTAFDEALYALDKLVQ